VTTSQLLIPRQVVPRQGTQNMGNMRVAAVIRMEGRSPTLSIQATVSRDMSHMAAAAGDDSPTAPQHFSSKVSTLIPTLLSSPNPVRVRVRYAATPPQVSRASDCYSHSQIPSPVLQDAPLALVIPGIDQHQV
jgi:hypothetical protein